MGHQETTKNHVKHAPEIDIRITTTRGGPGAPPAGTWNHPLAFYWPTLAFKQSSIATEQNS